MSTWYVARYYLKISVEILRKTDNLTFIQGNQFPGWCLKLRPKYVVGPLTTISRFRHKCVCCHICNLRSGPHIACGGFICLSNWNFGSYSLLCSPSSVYATGCGDGRKWPWHIPYGITIPAHLITFCLVGRGELSYLAPLGIEKISAPYFKQCFFLGGGITPQAESNTTPPSPKTEITNNLFYILNFASIIKFKM